MTKKCSVCKKEYEVNCKNFNRNKNSKDGFQYFCRKCLRIYRQRPEVKESCRKIQRTEQYKIDKRIRCQSQRENSERFRLDNSMGCALWLLLKKNKGGKRLLNIVDWTLEELLVHIEKQFIDKMNWNNYGTYWEIDHIKPKCIFNYETVEENSFAECWAKRNLRPLKRSANRKSIISKIGLKSKFIK